MATREIYWNIAFHELLYPALAVALLVCAYGMLRKYKAWQRGGSGQRLSKVPAHIRFMLAESFGQRRVRRDAKPGFLHALMVWGFFLLFATTAAIAIQTYLGIPLFLGAPYLFFKVLANTAGLCLLVSLVALLIRRLRPPVHLGKTGNDLGVLLLLGAIVLSGFVLEALRLAVLDDPWGAFGYVGWLLAPVFRSTLALSTLTTLHVIFWWLHLLLSLFCIAWLPFSKLFHIALAPVGQLYARIDAIGALEAIDFEDPSVEVYGKSTQHEFTWKSLFDVDACVQCGRCQKNCPAQASEKHLNPRAIIQRLKEQSAHNLDEQLPGLIIAEPDIWACTTCRSCEEHCPLFIEHVDRLLELRRWLVLTQDRYPRELQLAFRNLENNGNAWGVGFAARQGSYDDAGIKVSDQPEILLWPGCAAAFDQRNQRVLRAFVSLLNKAQVRYTVLGNKERCCGDSARRLGNEYLFQTLAAENIASLEATGLRRIVTTCPHCVQTLKADYKVFGADFEVVHHTEYLVELIETLRLAVDTAGGRVFYHDSCYLGRYQGKYQAPRALLAAAGYTVIEAPRNKEAGFCCGGGGGRMWMDEQEGRAVSKCRYQEFEPPTLPIATACPYCLTMLEDARGSSGQTRDILDISELLAVLTYDN